MVNLMMKTEIRGGLAVEMFKTSHGKPYAVRYGLQSQTFTTLDEAYSEFESCQKHNMSCAGYEVDGDG